MNEEQKSSQEIAMGEGEQVLEFEFEDLSGDGSPESASSADDEEIIELVDIVEEKGEAFDLEELTGEEKGETAEKPLAEASEPEIEPASLLEEQAPPTPEFHIDEQRLEQLVTEAVERVVERVARQTMAEVAERLISEAIESLKESLEEASQP